MTRSKLQRFEMAACSLAVALMCGVIVLLAVAFAPPADATGRDWAPCANDEYVPGVRCVWDARHQGDGNGRSFFTNASGAHYVSHARAHRMILAGSLALEGARDDSPEANAAPWGVCDCGQKHADYRHDEEMAR